MKRRLFLIGSAAAAGGLFLGYGSHLDGLDRRARELTAQPNSTLLAGWVRIGTDDTITVYVPHVDMGQGSQTALAMMLAEELDADWSHVRVEQAPADKAFANRFLAESFVLQGRPVPQFLDGTIDRVFGELTRRMNVQASGGSSAVRMTGEAGMRVVGAAARDMLIRAAARAWDVSSDEISARHSKVRHFATGRTARYAELAPAAALLCVPASPGLKRRHEFSLIGTSPPRLDIPAKVTGEHRYGLDLTLPHLLYATVRAAPVHGARLITMDASAAQAIDGVERVMQLDTCAVVMARSYWIAAQAASALQLTFSDTHAARASTASIYAQQDAALAANALTEEHSVGDAEQQLSGAKIVEQSYRVPFLHQAALEPINVTAQFVDGSLTVWAGEQNPLGALATLIQLSGLAPEQVKFIPLPVGGSFGRRAVHSELQLGQAIAAARAVSPRPVKLIWSRQEDFTQGTYRPQLTSRFRSSLGADGKPLAWSQIFVQGADLPEPTHLIPYAIAHQHIRSCASPVHVRTGFFRSVNYSQHGFWKESFIDELAHAAGVDPLDYRLSLLESGSRPSRILKIVAEKSAWHTPAPIGIGRGVALVESFGTWVAQVIELTLDAEGRPRVHRVVAAVDCGDVVHPDTATQQVEGAIVMGLSTALNERITIERGAVVEQSYYDYPVLTLASTPIIEVHLVPSGAAYGGLGESGVPPVAPALANALFALTGKRIRTLPLTPHFNGQV